MLANTSMMYARLSIISAMQLCCNVRCTSYIRLRHRKVSFCLLQSSGANAKFWNYQWEKHGTCSTDVLRTQKEYFDKTLELDEKYDISVS